MASIIRPAAPVLRQSCFTLSSSARRAAFYSTKSPFAAITTVKPVQSRTKNGPAQIAQFHATSKRNILPPEPRECYILGSKETEGMAVTWWP